MDSMMIRHLRESISLLPTEDLGPAREFYRRLFELAPELRPLFKDEAVNGEGLVKQNNRYLSLLRWGLVPSWSKDASGAARMINARSEKVDELPAFRDALKSRRCLIPAFRYED